MSLLSKPPTSNTKLTRLGQTLRRARLAAGWESSDELGRTIGCSGRTIRAMEATGRGNTECLLRILNQLSPKAIEELITRIEEVKPSYSSLSEALGEDDAS